MPKPAPLSALLADSAQSGAHENATPVQCVTRKNWEALKLSLPEAARRFADAHAYEPAPGRHIILPDRDGAIAAVIIGREEDSARRVDPFGPGRVAPLLPEGLYRLEGELTDLPLAALGWLLSAYRFDSYRTPKPAKARLAVPAHVDLASLGRIVDAVAMGRDLVNTPANDCGPEDIEAAIRILATRHGARVTSIVGDALLEAGFPMVHAVGRAAARAPRLVDMVWGNPAHPKVTLVGKGVCFDTGGLNIKPDNSMLLMKKDMGGAATAIAAAQMIMGAGLPVRLRLIVPTAENAISGNAFRPGDVLPSRKGITVEIGNTDAEGRLILADALALADEERPDLLIDFATLTGAARVALGPDLPPLYTHDDVLAHDMERIGSAINDPVWRMPLWSPYDAMLDSKIADVNHTALSPFAGSITAALFLSRFVEKTQAHAHFDIFGWNPSTKPGRPEGGEVMTARLTYHLVAERFGTKG
jgi:leucyl aminopeptidase